VVHGSVNRFEEQTLKNFKFFFSSLPMFLW
jgi:hypothetical protein